RLRRRLVDAGLDGAVLRKPANVHYLTGFPGNFDRPSFAVIGADQVVVVGPGSSEAVRKAARSATDVAGYHVPGATVDRVADVDGGSAIALVWAIERAGLTGKRVGVETADVSAH